MKVSVILPALNEEQTIANVIDVCKKSSEVHEIIVVDDHSFDNTIVNAKKAGASVILSTKRGKGASMRDGLLVSSGEILTYLDADILKFQDDLIENLTRPIMDDETDFVKSTFKRQAGRVTELVAKPLLSLLFPEALRFSQPLSGMIAGKKSVFEKVTFEDDYGVDIGILLDMLSLGCRIKEVSIGHIENKMKQWQQLEPMAREVAKAILKRAKILPAFTLDALQTTSLILDQMDLAVKESLKTLNKMVIFDMDDTVLMGRYIYQAAEEFNFKKELLDIINNNKDSYLIMKMIAHLLKGLNLAQLLSVADKIPLVPDVVEIIAELKKRGYVVGVLSDSYHFVAEHTAHKIAADFSIAHELEFSQSMATGEIKVLSYFAKNSRSKCNHNFCKSNVMLHLSEKYNIPLENIITLGDSESDICLIKYAGIGVAFCSKNNILNSVADMRISQKSFLSLLDIAT